MQSLKLYYDKCKKCYILNLTVICVYFRAVNDGPIDTYQLKSLDGQFGNYI